LQFVTHALIEARGAKCPKCGSTNTDRQGGSGIVMIVEKNGDGAIYWWIPIGS